MDKPDINIIQDIEVLQGMMKPFLEKFADKDSINQFNIIVQANKIDGISPQVKHDQRASRFVLPDVKNAPQTAEYPSWMHESLFRILEALPQPRYCNLIKLMIKVAYSKFRKKTEAAKWIGMGQQAFGAWTNRFNLRSKYTAVENLENRIKKINLKEV